MELSAGAGRKAKQKNEAAENFKSSQRSELQQRQQQLKATQMDSKGVAATTSTTGNNLNSTISSPTKTTAAAHNQVLQNDQQQQPTLPWSTTTTTYSMPIYSSFVGSDMQLSPVGYPVDGVEQSESSQFESAENSNIDLGLLAFYNALNFGHESNKTILSCGSNLMNRFNNQSNTSDSNLFLNEDHHSSNSSGRAASVNKKQQIAQSTNHYQLNHDDIFGRSYSCVLSSSQPIIRSSPQLHQAASGATRFSMFNIPSPQTIGDGVGTTTATSTAAAASCESKVHPTSEQGRLSALFAASQQQQQEASFHQTAGRQLGELFSNSTASYQLSDSQTVVGQKYASLFDSSSAVGQELQVGGGTDGLSPTISSNANYFPSTSNSSTGQRATFSSSNNLSGNNKRRNKLPFFPGGSAGGFVGDNRHRMKLDLHGASSSDANGSERFSRKVFVGGLPPDIDEEEIKTSFRRFGSLLVDWPHKTESKSYFPPKGYAFLLFQEESSVQALIDSCIREDDKLYLCVSSPTIKDKPVQIRPWRLSDADFVSDSAIALDPKKTVFVGGVPRPLKASELANMMNNLYGGVCYAGIDTDPELKYPKGAGRVAFSNHQSYIAAISARYVHLHHSEVEKRVEVKPYVLDDQFCDECQGSRCDNKFAPFFCANITCLRYYCDGCWASVHSQPGREFHKPLVKESVNRPRGLPASTRWSGVSNNNQ